ncbi:MAG: 6,7-dimethyl-8-ribityllumazine synthase [Verrucomicrobiales bacterium]|nr:6,7-dimethyl-8-ribityllumazine synthase [Verrucomicrobiales bacterium]
MLKRIRSRKAAPTTSPARIAIVASEYNRKHVDGLLDAAVRTLKEAAVEVDVYRVPGAFEIPVVAETLASDASRRWSAVVCLGVIIRGETGHADLVGTAVTQALMRIAVTNRVPVIHEVLLVASKEQADARCLEARFNRGAEAAQTALAMARLMRRLPVSPGASLREE